MRITICKSVRVNGDFLIKDKQEFPESILCGSDKPFGEDYELVTIIAYRRANEITVIYRHKSKADDVTESAA